MKRYKVWKLGDLMLRTGSEGDESFDGSMNQVAELACGKAGYSGGVVVKDFDTDEIGVFQIVRPSVHLLFNVIEIYGDTDPPEPWGYYEHPSAEVPKVGDVIMLKTLDDRDHHRVKIVSVDGSELRTIQIDHHA